VLGDRVRVACGVEIYGGVRVEDEVVVGANVAFARPPLDRGAAFPPTVIQRGALVGANATVVGGVTIGARAVVSPGAVVTHNVPANAIVTGNPAYIVGYVDTPPAAFGREPGKPLPAGRTDTPVRGVTVHYLPVVEDLRGDLSFAEVERHVPFPVARYFVVFNVPTEEVRGEHAHKSNRQFMVCVHGRCHVVVDDGEHRQEIVLDKPNIGVHVGPLVWATQYKYSRDGVLLVLASEAYNPEDYIRDYTAFLALVRPDTAP
jgi:dTDP-4-dehydrorhamnose 3,5-epimerase-like enzyme